MPLACPDLDNLPEFEVLAACPAVRVFVEAATRADPEYRLTRREARIVSAICDRLDGLPLALELAAARMNMMTTTMILDRLDQHLSLLRLDSSDLPERHHTLRSAIAWSYDILSTDEQAALHRLSVFVDGFDLEGAEAVLARDDSTTVDALETVGALVDGSLLLMEEHDGRARYRWLRTVHDFANEQLDKLGEATEAGARHARFFQNMVGTARHGIRGSDQRLWFARLDEDGPNWRAALHWLLATGDHEGAQRLALSLAPFWLIRGHHAEGLRWLTNALGSNEAQDPVLRARTLAETGLFLSYGGHQPAARSRLLQAQELATSSDDSVGTALALTGLAISRAFGAAWPQALEGLEQAFIAWRMLNDQSQMAFVQVFLGAASFMLDDIGYARAHYGEALYIYRCLGDFSATIPTLCHLALAQASLADPSGAVASVEQALHTNRAVGDAWRLGIAVEATLLVRGPDLPMDDRQQLLGSRDSLPEMNGLLIKAWEPVSRRYARMTRQPMAGDPDSRPYQDGRRLSAPAVIDLAEALLQQTGTAAQSPSPTTVEPAGIELSARELGVIRLVAEGLSSKAVGRRLFISTSTVNYHLTSVFNKFGVDNRAHAVAVAASKGIL
jgi:non-specific serine/threonine protein kinase